MLNKLINTLLGCSHRRTSFPITPGRRAAGYSVSSRQGTYIVCLDCGQEFAYNWAEMRAGEPVEKPKPVPVAAPVPELSTRLTGV